MWRCSSEKPFCFEEIFFLVCVVVADVSARLSALILVCLATMAGGWLSAENICHGIYSESVTCISSAFSCFRSKRCSTTFSLDLQDQIVMVNNSMMMLIIGERICIFDSSEWYFLAAFNIAHCPYKSADLVFFCELKRCVWCQEWALTHGVNIPRRAVLWWWCPSWYYESWSVDAAFDVVSYDDETSAQSHFQWLKLLKARICLRLQLSEPIVTLDYVQWIVVAYAARLLCHMSLVYSQYQREKLWARETARRSCSFLLRPRVSLLWRERQRRIWQQPGMSWQRRTFLSGGWWNGWW